MKSSGETDHQAWPAVQAAIARAGAGSDVRIGVSVRDCRHGTGFSHAANQVFPAASTVKLVILVALAQALDDGRLRLDQRTPALAEHRVAGSGVLNWLEYGLELTLQDHAWLMIAISDNTASNVLIDILGLPVIQDIPQTLGLESTSLNRRFLGRLPVDGTPENVTTASDLTTILVAIADGSAASPERCEWMLTLLGDQQVTDRLARRLLNGVTFAGKSGWARGISHDVGLLCGPGGEAAVAVMTQGFEDPYAADALIGSIGVAVIDDLELSENGGGSHSLDGKNG